MSFSYFHVTLTSVRQVRMFFRQMKRNVPGPRFVMITISIRQKSASPHPHHFSSGGEFSMYSWWKSNLFAMKAIYRKIRALFNWPSVIKVPYLASILGKNRLFQKAKKRWGWRGLAREIFRPKRFETYVLVRPRHNPWPCGMPWTIPQRCSGGKDGGRVEKTNFVGRWTSTLHFGIFMYALTACLWSNWGHWWWEPFSTMNLRTADSSWYAT